MVEIRPLGSPPIPLFEIGNGADATHLADALIVYKNGNLTANGADNLMPNQTLTGANSVLTEGLADSRYTRVSTFASLTSFAIMPNASASGYSMAVGLYANAGSYGSIALGNYTSASGEYSVAMGQGSTASANYSTAMGRGTATGTGSTAMGWWTNANGRAQLQWDYIRLQVEIIRLRRDITHQRVAPIL